MNPSERSEPDRDDSTSPVAVADSPTEEQRNGRGKRSSTSKEKKEPKLPFWEFVGGLYAGPACPPSCADAENEGLSFPLSRTPHFMSLWAA
jgi:hypothetical protein